MGYKSIQNAFSQLGITLSDQNSKLLLKRFDEDRDDNLTYVDVVDFFTPKEPTFKAELAERLTLNHINTKISHETAVHLRRLFHNHL